MQHEANADQVVAIVIKERATAGAVIEWPAERMLHQPALMFFRRDLPQFFDADAVFLRLVAFVEPEALNELLGQRPARAFTDECVFALELHAAHEAVFYLACAPNAHIAGCNAGDRAVIVVEDFGSCKARIDFNAKFSGLLAEPFGERTKTDNIVAMIFHERRHRPVGQTHIASRSED